MRWRPRGSSFKRAPPLCLQLGLCVVPRPVGCKYSVRICGPPTLCLGDMCSTQRREPVPPGQMLCQSLGEDAFIAATPNFGTRVGGGFGRTAARLGESRFPLQHRTVVRRRPGAAALACLRTSGHVASPPRNSCGKAPRVWPDRRFHLRGAGREGGQTCRRDRAGYHPDSPAVLSEGVGPYNRLSSI